MSTSAILILMFLASPGVFSQTDTQSIATQTTIPKWNNIWKVSNYDLPRETANHQRFFRPENVKDSPTSIVLTLDQKNTDHGIESIGGEIVSQTLFGFGTFQFSADMPMGVSGTVSAGFLYLSDSETEIDVEQQGCKPGRFDFTNWTSESKQLKKNSDATGFDPGPHRFVIVWTPKKIEWSIDGVMVATHIEKIPQKEAHFIFNLWGTNSPNWGGTATANHQRQMTVSSFQFTPLTLGHQ